MRRTFFTLDVFTQTRFTGNPLAVVSEPDGLETPAMQAIAREFSHPETVFVFPPDNASHRAKLRIFTPAAEIPFAGHPTVGTAVLLAHLDGGGAREFIVREKIGPVSCRCEPGGRASFVIPAIPKALAIDIAAKDAAAALSLDAADIGGAPARWSGGAGFVFVPMRSLDALARARVDPAHFERVFGIDSPAKVYLYCAQQGDCDFRARMFAPGMGVPEDPATGSAAAEFSGLLAAGDRYGDGTHTVRIVQGVEMGRPSHIELGLTITGGALSSATIGGNAVLVTEGTIEA